MENFLFEIVCPLGFRVRTTYKYWDIILQKHPELDNNLNEVIKTLKEPEQIRKSKRDEKVFLLYRKLDKYFLCVVIKQELKFGIVVTCYLTDKIKEGERIWPK